MEQQQINQEILRKLNQIKIDVDILKKNIIGSDLLIEPEEESECELLNQVNESLEDAKAGRIIRVA